eukprot:TRINITY_DN29745_c0_g1_i1.p1 TRINITY_DN29745_c0_g1~~TRINITY_DN29745_c0_g1_i1.p1  ORF type:complete len:373 (-),score=48.70 TRINITY_DN29745_c0_g1_i1:73-1191(-)
MAEKQSSSSTELDYVAHTLAFQGPSADGIHRVACGSFNTEAQNFVDIFTLDFDTGSQGAKFSSRLPHYFPPTRVKWLGGAPNTQGLVATSGDFVRIWNVNGELVQLLPNEKNPQDVCTPITSVDASCGSEGSVCLASCDVYGLCNFWDAERGAVQQAIDLGQPLCDVAFGPNRLVAVAGEQGDCFLLDLRQPKTAHILKLREKVRGPARVAWGPQRPDLFAIAWQGQEGGVAMYDPGMSGGEGGKAGRRSGAEQQLLRSTKAGGVSTLADIQWSPAFPEYLCCATEEGVVEVWQFPLGAKDAAALSAAGPSFWWEPHRGEVCTALTLTHQVSSQNHYVIAATMPGQGTASSHASLWVAGPLPVPAPVGSISA